MYRDALLGRKQNNVANAPKPRALTYAEEVAALSAPPVTHCNSSSSVKSNNKASVSSNPDNWKRIGRRLPTSNWSGYAFIDATTGSVSLNAKNVKYEKTRSVHPVPLILDFSESASPVRLVSLRVYPEVKVPAPPAETDGKHRRRPTVPTAVPIKSSNLSFAVDSALQLSRGEKLDPKFLTFAKRDGTPLDPEMVFQDTYDTRGEEYRVSINFGSDEQRTTAVLEKLRLGDRMAREADELPAAASVTKPKADEPAPKHKPISPKFSKQTQAVRWYFTALLLTSSVHAVEGGLAPLLCNRLAALWIKMEVPQVGLRWAKEALKMAPTDFHGHLHRCQALLALDRADEMVAAANSALALLGRSCGPIKRLLGAAQAKGRPSKAAPPKPAWRLCDDLTGLIFSFLEQSERDEAASVCKSWAAISRKVSRIELIQREPEYLAAYKRAQRHSEVKLEGLRTFSSMKSSGLRWTSGLPIAFLQKCLETLNPQKLEWALVTWPHLKHGKSEDRSILGLCLQKLSTCTQEERNQVVEMVRVALTHGCNPNVRIGSKIHSWEVEGLKTTKQPRPLELALAQGRDVAELLVQHGAVPELLIRNIMNDKKLETVESLIFISPELLSKKATARKLVKGCVKSGWIEGLKFFINKCVLKRFSSIVEEMIELVLSRFEGMVQAGVSDELWVDASKLPFTIEALKLLFNERNCSGAPMADETKAMKMAKQLDAILWTTPLQRLLRGAPVRDTFELYSVNININSSDGNNNKPEPVV